jgi:hypothetical protein
MKRTPKERRFELAERIDGTADVVALLRINSTADAIAELRAIAEELRVVDDEKKPSALKEAGDAVLKVLLRLLDQLGTVRAARMAISGPLALVLGGAGWPAVTAFGICLAFWEGKDTFTRAVQSIWGAKK